MSLLKQKSGVVNINIVKHDQQCTTSRFELSQLKKIKTDWSALTGQYQ